MSAEAIAEALGGRRTGAGWMACCPAHPDTHPSLSINELPNGKILVRCHAGCKQATVIDALRRRGLWGRLMPLPSEPSSEPCRPKGSNTPAAMRIWSRCRPAQSSLVETYLASRGLTLPATDDLRFHPKLRHLTGSVHPAMVALVRNAVTGQPVAIHRTFLEAGGSGKAAVKDEKLSLGPCRGGAVRLAPATDALMIGEGIETCLAAMVYCGAPAWAALSAPGLRSLELPLHIRDVTVLADGDEAGEAAAGASSTRWASEGRLVRIVRAPRDMDFNDLLIMRQQLASAGGPQ